ncbi:HNH endonuclease signature motif containing protein [Herbiconiux daphne]|uniref:HNH endonuclease n=1 Tax=Herbiconiux daphne TaxID=2970914 RepID=A0ABT2H9V2_9MICO|nr:HNH endonuclease signature motif containing protein [Herbiconiux daphne]MCS5736647.1 HNH endonuclease [Herbiconiux daphne]
MRTEEEQMLFRKQVLHNFENRCAITGTHFREDTVDAAHIRFYRNGGSMSVVNGIPLLSKLHTLHDEFLLSIHPEYQTIHFAIDGMKYEGQRIREHNFYLDKGSLIWHWKEFISVRAELSLLNKRSDIIEQCMLEVV